MNNNSVEYYCNSCHIQSRGEIISESFVNTNVLLVKIKFSACNHSRIIFMKPCEILAIKKGFKKSLKGRRFITPQTTKEIQSLTFCRT